MDSEAANYATAVEDRKSFYEDTVMPRARKYESVLNTQLLEREGLRLEFAFNELELFQDDENQRAELLLNYVQAGMPIELAMRKAGIELTDEEMSMLETHQEERDEQVQPPSRFDEELGRWMRFAEKRIKDGRELREFETDIIPKGLHAAISGQLEAITDADDVGRVFEQAKEWKGYP
jgi:hypothetical protein